MPRERRSATVAIFVALSVGKVVAAGESTPAGDARALQTIDTRQMILGNQVDMARRTARWRARELYRVLRTAPAPGAPGALSDADRARAVVVGARALARELGETRVLAVELAQARAERATFPAAPAAAVASGTASAPPDFVTPAVGPVRIGSRFGAVRDPATGLSLIQTGVRIDTPAGALVVAPARGTVDRVAPTPAGSLALQINHGGGWTSILTGLLAVEVEAGQRIAAGQRVGWVAAAPPGMAGGITLELWRGRKAVDPARYIRLPPPR